MGRTLSMLYRPDDKGPRSCRLARLAPQTPQETGHALRPWARLGRPPAEPIPLGADPPQPRPQPLLPRTLGRPAARSSPPRSRAAERCPARGRGSASCRMRGRSRPARRVGASSRRTRARPGTLGVPRLSDSPRVHQASLEVVAVVAHVVGLAEPGQPAPPTGASGSSSVTVPRPARHLEQADASRGEDPGDLAPWPRRSSGTCSSTW